MSTRAATAAPPFPYQPGSKLEIKAHTPPQPYGAQYGNKELVRRPVRGLVDDYGNNLVDHMGFVISNPPLDTPAPANIGAQPARVLTIIDVVSHKPKEQGGGPVIVSCYLDADESTTYVAKIYDGFEYELAEPGKRSSDCMYWADLHYSREAAAYESIPARFQGSIVPRYFGSWTFPLPTGAPGRHRWVRMILIEYIHGECMLDMILRAWGATRASPRPARWREESQSLDYSLLPPEHERLDILARIVEADTMLWWYGGVSHGDMEPRNVMVSRSGPANAVSRITLIDFNNAFVLHRCDRGRQIIENLGLGKGLPPSPIERYWTGSQFAYGGTYGEWIPESWAVDDDGYEVSHVLAAKWLILQWRASSKFRPPSEKFLNCPSHENMDEPYRQMIKELKSFLRKNQQPSGQKEHNTATNGTGPSPRPGSSRGVGEKQA
jgi:hypothetical protein